jgi:hypothetical protein
VKWYDVEVTRAVRAVRAVRAALSIAVMVAGAGAGCRRDTEPPAGPAPRAPESAGGSGSGSAMAAVGSGVVGSGAALGPGPGAGSAGANATDACKELPFAESTPVPEASGAAWLSIEGTPRLFVIGDSGNNGAYVLVDPETGATVEQGKLPLGGEGEDLEGIAVRGGRFYVITSPGWMRVYERKGSGFALLDGPYPLGPIDIEDKGGGMGDKPPKGNGMVCGAKNVNCGRNYEGLCLAPGPVSGRCIGFAAAKADGHLYCIVETGGKLAVEYSLSIKIARSGVIADCAFSEDGRLYVGSNLFDLANVYRITGWEDPAHAKVTRLGPLPSGFPETLAVRGDIFYRMSDTGGSPSAMKKYRCPGL